MDSRIMHGLLDTDAYLLDSDRRIFTLVCLNVDASTGLLSFASMVGVEEMGGDRNA